MFDRIETLAREHTLSREDLAALIRGRTPELAQALYRLADAQRRQYYGNAVYVRGLIEFTNFCKNNCLYCGIRCGSEAVSRYRQQARISSSSSR